jgi:UDP-N-acetylmuramoyl-L-alanyl-D-glutamate--2,6-diaminopimelate ligase
VAGLGRAGRAAVAALVRRAGGDAVIGGVEDTERSMQRVRASLGVSVQLGPPTDLRARGIRTVVKSPGIAMDAPLIARARELGIEVIDELELGWLLQQAPIVAVTGTNGKSTVAGLIRDVIGPRAHLAGNTYFGPPLSAVTADAGDRVVCEVSSFQLEACPTFLPDLAVFTNLTHEHLGRHRTMEAYAAAKRRMFVRGETVVPLAVIDVEDVFGRELAADVEAGGGRVARVGDEYRVEEAGWDLRHARCVLRTPNGTVELTSRLPGAYNARNIAAAVAAADLLGVGREDAARAIAVFPGVPGRFERIDVGQDCDVIVDFAHTPDGVEQFLQAVRAGMVRGRRLTTVLGLGSRGDDAGHEAIGRAAGALSDRLILTTSGYQGQPRMVSLQSFVRGARSVPGAEYEIVLDRRAAFERAIEGATGDDVIVIPGRGSFTRLNPGPGVEIPFDDRAVAREVLSLAFRS